MALSDTGQLNRKLIFPGVIFFLKSGATLQIELHSYRARVSYNQERNLLSLRFNMINLKG